MQIIELKKASSDFRSLTTRIVQTANRGVGIQILSDSSRIEMKLTALAQFHEIKQAPHSTAILGSSLKPS